MLVYLLELLFACSLAPLMYFYSSKGFYTAAGSLIC